uniref:Micro-fibrillar-associated protein 1 C-terminal domain-containing protein n=1 Tax=Tetradesmus obliquus TaxID=3088 RepID=A0A383V586_TETOB|eukprot:jgi/Sobl393_1/18242/SZX60767.1
MAGALAARHTDKELEKGRVEKTTVKRYWPGRAPAWVESQQQDAVPADEALAQQVQRTAISAPVVVKKVADPRLARLAQRQVDRDEAVEEHRQIRAAEVVRRRHQQQSSSDEEESSEEEDEEEQQEQQPEAEVDEEELQQRRDALKERLRQQQQQQDLLAAPGEEEEEEESSEYETDSESEEEGGPGRAKLVRPVFVRKQERETIAEREALEQQEEVDAEQQKQRASERQQETRQLLVQVIAADEAAARAAAAPVALKEYEEIDTGDEAEPDAIDQWQRREAARIRRDHGEREAAEAEAAEREKLRNMTEEERMAYLKANPKEPVESKQKAKWRYLQKYWHKGAFFQDSADDARGTAGPSEVYGRDYSAPTGEDNFDKSALPEVMQVRNFGRSGRTKWKHLLAEDTSTARREDDWYRREEKLAGAVAGGYSRDAAALGADVYGGAAKRSGEVLSQGFVKPKKFKT